MNFKINQVVKNTKNKEIIKLTNGIEKDGNFIPTEAIALRVLGLNKGMPVIGYTYISVKPEDLAQTIADRSGHFESILGVEKPTKYFFVGRI